jgi:hypothetical protein
MSGKREVEDVPTSRIFPLSRHRSCVRVILLPNNTCMSTACWSSLSLGVQCSFLSNIQDIVLFAISMHYHRVAMVASLDEVQLFGLLVEVIGVKNVIEVTVFTGYSLLATVP